MRYQTVLSIFFLFVSLLFTFPLYASELYFPHIASDGDWETEISIVNAGESTLSGTLYGYDNSGSLIESKAVKLKAGARMELTIGLDFLNPSEITYIKLVSGESSCVGYEKFYRSGIYRAAVPAVSSVNTGDLYVTHIASDSDWWTGLALLNTNATETTLTFTFSDGSQRELNLAAKQHWAGTIAGSFPGVNAESAVISNANGVIGLELFGSQEDSDNYYLSGILLSNQTANSLYYPHVASDTQWWTGIVAYNPSTTTTANLTITPYNSQGLSLGSIPVTISAQGKYVGTASALNFPFGTEWFKITSDLPISGFELFGTHDGKQLAGYSVVNINTTDGAFVKLDHEGWTGIALVNSSSSSATVTLNAKDNNGSTIATNTLSLSAYGKLVALAEGLFSSSIASARYISFSSKQEVVGFQLNGSSDEMMLDALPGIATTIQ